MGARHLYWILTGPSFAVVSLFFHLCVADRTILTEWGGQRGWARSQSLRPREILALYKSFSNHCIEYFERQEKGWKLGYYICEYFRKANLRCSSLKVKNARFQSGNDGRNTKKQIYAFRSAKRTVGVAQTDNSAYEEQESTFPGNTKLLTVIICSREHTKKLHCVKKFSDIPVPS